LLDPTRCLQRTFRGPGSDDLVFLPSILIDLGIEMTDCQGVEAIDRFASSSVPTLRFPSTCDCAKCCRPIHCRDLRKIAQCNICFAIGFSVICDACVLWPTTHNHDIINAGLCAHSHDAYSSLNPDTEVKYILLTNFT
jgi:hypothetical protein